VLSPVAAPFGWRYNQDDRSRGAPRQQKAKETAEVRKTTLSEYVEEGLTLARYEFCEKTKQWCAYVDELPGTWAQDDAVETTRSELAEVIEGWVIVALQHNDRIPTINGVAVGRPRKRAKHAATQAS